MTTGEILQRARDLVRKGWCRNVSAKNRHGTAVSWLSPMATKFCSLGAIWRVVAGIGGTETYPAEKAAKIALRKAAGCPEIIHWNDNPKQKKAAVLTAFDRAIAAEQKKAR